MPFPSTVRDWGAPFPPSHPDLGSDAFTHPSLPHSQGESSLSCFNTFFFFFLTTVFKEPTQEHRTHLPGKYDISNEIECKTQFRVKDTPQISSTKNTNTNFSNYKILPPYRFLISNTAIRPGDVLTVVLYTVV